MRKTKLWVLAGFPILLAACGGGDEGAAGGGLESDTAAPAPAAGPMDTEAMAGGGGMATTVTMQALNNSSVTGEATLTPQGQQVQVMVRLTGMQGQGEHPGHIHAGTCDAPGSVVQPLQPITPGADGSGTMTASVSVDPNTVMNGQHIIQYHQAGGGPGIVCGNITAHQM